MLVFLRNHLWIVLCIAFVLIFFPILLSILRKKKPEKAGLPGWKAVLFPGGSIVVILAGAVAGHLLLPFLPWPPSVRSASSKALTISAVFLAAFFLSQIIGNLLFRGKKKTVNEPATTSIFRNLITVIITALGLLIALQTLGISITPILTALGVGGLAVALALQETLSNLFAGFALILSHKIKPGEYIRLDSGEEGYVLDTNWRHTKIRALQNNLHIIPNSRLAASVITNFEHPDSELAVLINLGVDYASDLEKVERVTSSVGTEVMKEVEGGVPGFVPFIRYNSFNDSSIGFTAILRARDYAGQYLVRHEFIKRLKARFDREGIVIPFPIRTLEWRTGSSPPPKT